MNIYKALLRRRLHLPLFLGRVPAGFPSPADDYLDKALDLNEHLIEHPAATFFVKVKGDSMINAGIFPNDILVVDRSKEAAHGHVVVAILNGEFTVKKIQRTKTRLLLVSENPQYPPFEVSPDADFEVWGVVRHVIHSFP